MHSEFFPQIEKWALCFRDFDHAGTDTNNFVERLVTTHHLCPQAVITMCINPFSFHNKLKTNPKYLNHRVNRRCDDLLETLLLFEEDMFHQRKYCETMSQASAKHDAVDRQRTETEKDVKV